MSFDYSHSFDFTNAKLAFFIDPEFEHHMVKIFDSAKLQFLSFDEILKNGNCYELIVLQISRFDKDFASTDILKLMERVKLTKQAKLICLWSKFF
ncbi:MAG: hypothetical protein AAGD96_27995, partial [Chloroflexota bacterium]